MQNLSNVYFRSSLNQRYAQLLIQSNFNNYLRFNYGTNFCNLDYLRTIFILEFVKSCCLSNTCCFPLSHIMTSGVR